MALQLRRGTNAERLGMTPANGELIYVTDYESVTTSVTSIDTTTETLTTTVAHGLSVNQQVKYIGPTLNGLTANTVYFVKTAPTITTFTLSTTLGGSTVNITGSFTIDLLFAVTPTLASGAPVGEGVSPLWIGDGVTTGGDIAVNLNLDDLLDVEITAVAEGNTFYYDATTGFWRNTSLVTIDDVDGQVGVNNPTPNFTLDVGGDTYVGGELYVAGADVFTGADNVRLQINRTVASGDSQSTFKRALLLKSSTAGTPALGYGSALGFIGQTTATTSGNFEEAGAIAVRATDFTATAESFEMTFNLMNAGTEDVERMVLDSLGNLQIDGDLTVTGNDIKSSTATAVTLSGADVTVAGDLTVTGNDIKSSGGTTAVTLSGADVTVAGDLTVTGNDIKSSSATAVTLSGADVTVAGDLAVNGGDITTSQSTGNLFNTTATTVNLAGAATQVNIGITGAGAVDILPTTDSTSPTTGALQVAGGVGIVKNLHVGGKITTDDTTEATNTTTGSIQTDGGVGIQKKLHVGGTISVDDTAEATNTTTGSIQTDGGVGIVKKLHVGGTIRVDDTANATSAVTGSIQTDGGVGIALDLFAGGAATITGDLAVNGGDLTTTAGTATLFNTTATTVNIGGAATTMSIGNSAGTITIPGNLTVNGTTTTINSQTLLVADKNIEMGVVATPTDVTADGGGIILRGTTDKEILYNNSLTRWVSNIGFNMSESTIGNVSIASGANDNLITTTTGNLELNGFTGLVEVVGDLQVTGNDIKSSTATAVTLSGADVAVAGDLTVTGNDIKSSTATALTLSGADVTVAGDLTVTGNDIKSSSATALTLTGANVTVAGDLAVNGGDLTTTSATTFNLLNTIVTTGNLFGAGTTVNIGAATGTTTVKNSLQVDGNTTLGSDSSDTVTVNGLVTDNITFSFNDTATPRGILGKTSTGAEDFWFVGGAEDNGTSNAGYAMIATGDDGTEPVYARQYTGSPLTGTVVAELTLLDASGNTLIPNDLSTNGDVFIENDKNLYISGTNLVLNNNDTAGATVDITSYRGVAGATSAGIRWNETTDRWQTTVDNSAYLNIPNQNLDTTDSVAFGAVAIDARSDIDTATLTTTAVTQVPLATSTRNVMKCVVYIVQGADVHTVEALVLRTGAGTAMVTTYGEMYSNTALATFAADTSGGAVRLLVTPANTTSMLFTSVITSLT